MVLDRGGQPADQRTQDTYRDPTAEFGDAPAAPGHFAVHVRRKLPETNAETRTARIRQERGQVIGIEGVRREVDRAKPIGHLGPERLEHIASEASRGVAQVLEQPS
ncbi:hypothetical protein C5613_34685 [Rhodococcus opacus]|uniref:Uncharacterized protein n=1 Tax=Rhodococcus opacus TaxID=37919 RepID=A0A2S8IRF3_RHOOP|nr:hypothetical protein C5613_34685 [Rhodococcus opacus]